MRSPVSKKRLYKRLFSLVFTLSLFISSGTSFSQSETDDKLVMVKELMNFKPIPTYSLNAGIQYNEEKDYSHPDFGKLTFQTPHDKNVVEVLDKRTSYERYYIDLDDPLFFYIEQSSKPINFMKDGYLRAIDPSLHERSHGYFESGVQPVPTALNSNEQWSQMTLNNEKVRFNSFDLKLVNNDGSVDYLEANWDNIVVGNFMAYVTDIFPEIDLIIKYDEASIKSDFVIKSNLNVKEIVFIDHLELSEGLGVLIDEEDTSNLETVQIYNTYTAETQAIFEPALSYESSGSYEGWLCSYELDGNDLHIKCDSAYLNAETTVYPIVIDPTFTAVGPVTAAGGIIGSLPSPASCNTNMNVTFPGGSTPYDVQASWNVTTNFCWWWWFNFGVIFDCWMQDAQVWLTSSCGGISPTGAPATIWNCIGCAAPGTWSPTLPFGADASSQTLAQCYTPSCADQTLTFTLNLNRIGCNIFTLGGTTYDDCTYANNQCVRLDSWSIWVQGRSVETLGNTVTGSGSLSIYDADCSGTTTLDPTPLWGVGPYTYLWSTTATTPTLTVPATSSIYTCTVTDACGTAVVATFDIGCPLSNDGLELNGLAQQNTTLLYWPEIEGLEVDYFAIQRADDTGEFIELDRINPINHKQGNEDNFVWIDRMPMKGTNYYRLMALTKEGTELLSEIKTVDFPENKISLTLLPNPASTEVMVVINDNQENVFSIKIRDLSGRVVKEAAVANETKIDVSDLRKGVYQIELYKQETLQQYQKLVKS